MEPIKNPVTGKGHRVVDEFSSGGFESSEWIWHTQKCLSQMMDVLTLNMKAPMGAFRTHSGKELGRDNNNNNELTGIKLGLFAFKLWLVHRLRQTTRLIQKVKILSDV